VIESENKEERKGSRERREKGDERRFEKQKSKRMRS
jgi:hypothetical protein